MCTTCNYTVTSGNYGFTASETGSTLRDRLEKLIYILHHEAHVSAVLSQWEDQNQTEFFYNFPLQNSSCTGCNWSGVNYSNDEDAVSHAKNLEILHAFEWFNSPACPGGGLGFDGLMLDYEYFAPDYGMASGTFASACTGFYDHWLPLADKFLTSK